MATHSPGRVGRESVVGNGRAATEIETLALNDELQIGTQRLKYRTNSGIERWGATGGVDRPGANNTWARKTLIGAHKCADLYSFAGTTTSGRRRYGSIRRSEEPTS